MQSPSALTYTPSDVLAAFSRGGDDAVCGRGPVPPWRAGLPSAVTAVKWAAGSLIVRVAICAVGRPIGASADSACRADDTPDAEATPSSEPLSRRQPSRLSHFALPAQRAETIGLS